MALALDTLTSLKRELSQTYNVRDTILYALGVGAGIDADTPAKLRYVYEENLQALPTMSVVLAAPGFWLRDQEFGIVWQQILHGEQSVTMHRPLPVSGKVRSTLTVDAIYDKGAEKGALLYSTRVLTDDKTGDLLATLRQGSFLRGNGGQGGSTEPSPKPHVLPDRAPDDSLTLQTRPEQALIYRLSGDFNPLHADPAVAATAGFKAPILHGLATYGVVGRALLSLVCDDDGSRLKQLDVRFSSPVYPGESITTEIWRDSPGKVSFRAIASPRGTVVINNGYAEYE